MFDLTDRDPTDRFSAVAELYDQYRPSYPVAALDWILEHGGGQLVDVGCGTGIASRQFAARGVDVIGIEPNAAMRQTAEALGGPIRYRAGDAAATGLPAASADLVLAAQAFHWFPAELALREFHRILKPGGWVALMWNERDVAAAFTARYSELMARHSPDRALALIEHCAAGEVLLHDPLFDNALRREFPNGQTLTVEQLVGRAFSVSYAPQETEPRRQMQAHLRALHNQFAVAGTVEMRYRTVVFRVRKPLVAERSDCYATG